MAITQHTDIPHRQHDIVKDADLTLRLFEYEEPSRSNGNQKILLQVHDFRVSSETLIKLPYFKILLRGDFKECGQDIVSLQEDDPDAVMVWLYIIHDNLVENAFHAYITTAWFMLEVADKYGFHEIPHGSSQQNQEVARVCRTARKWFAMWLNRYESERSYDQACMLLYPCHEFDDAAGFAALTKRVCYEASEYIMELHAPGARNNRLHLRSNIILALNAAKGRLRSVLARGINVPVFTLIHRAECVKKERVLWCYIEGLYATRAYPLDSNGPKIGMTETLKRLATFNATNPHDAESLKECAETVGLRSRVCGVGFKGVVSDACKETAELFDGLCLDCMYHSMSGNDDADYWRHANVGGKWDAYCRIKHGQATWYASFMGRKERRTEMTQRMKSKK